MAESRAKGSDETESSSSTMVSERNATISSTNPDKSISGVLPLLEEPSEEESAYFYQSLPSQPRLVGRTTAGIVKWELALRRQSPRTPIVAPALDLAPIRNHPIIGHWDAVKPRVIDSVARLDWTSVDVFRIGNKNQPTSQWPVVVWVGISSDKGAAAWEDVSTALRKCKLVLNSSGLVDVECHIRASQVPFLAGPRLLAPLRSGEANEHIMARPITTAMGLSCFPQRDNSLQATLGLFIRASRSDTAPLWALTCRHVALPSSQHPANIFYRRDHRSQPAHYVGAPGQKEFEKLQALVLGERARLSKGLQEPDLSEIQATIIRYRFDQADRLSRTIKSFEPISARSLGAVSVSPPIAPHHDDDHTRRPWTRDWCLVEIDQDKLPRNDNGQLPRNEVDLRSSELGWEDKITRMLNPNVKNAHKFKLADDGLLPLSGTIPVADMDKPTTLDENGEGCIFVGKHGAATGLTWGAPSEIMSEVRYCLPGKEPFRSTEWAVAGSLQGRTVAFTGPGDSGAVVFDVQGRVGGMVTSGAMRPNRGGQADVTYVTPMELILKDIEDVVGCKVMIV